MGGIRPIIVAAKQAKAEIHVCFNSVNRPFSAQWGQSAYNEDLLQTAPVLIFWPL
jgi:hypothetical protein